MKDYLPRANADFTLWLTNFKNKIATNATVLGLDSQVVTNLQDACTELSDFIATVEVKKNELKAATQAKQQNLQTNGGFLRTEIARIKVAPSYTEAIGMDLGIIGSGTGFDASSYKAQITAEIFGGFVRIKFKKVGADGVNIYHRKKGDSTWEFLARDTKSPYDDHVALTNNQPEHWEYRAFGVKDDLEIGISSDIIEIVIGS